MPTGPFIAWVLSLFLVASPPDRRPEPEEETRARYLEIAAHIVEVSLDAERPIFATGARPRSRSMALLASVAVLESGLRADVDDGRKRGKAGECTVFQLMPIRKGDCDAWLSDRQLATVRAHELMRRSARACLRARGREDHMLAAYASGNCGGGLEESRARVSQALRWFRDRPPPALPSSAPSLVAFGR